MEVSPGTHTSRSDPTPSLPTRLSQPRRWVQSPSHPSRWSTGPSRCSTVLPLAIDAQHIAGSGSSRIEKSFKDIFPSGVACITGRISKSYANDREGETTDDVWSSVHNFIKTSTVYAVESPGAGHSMCSSRSTRHFPYALTTEFRPPR